MMIYFLSDIHLGASYIKDEKQLELKVSELLRKMQQDATHVYLLGDIIDYWFEYKNVVPRGFVRFFGALAQLCDSGVKVVWLKGNHDIWMTDYLTSEIGCEIADGIIDVELENTRFVMGHGDGIGGPWVFRMLRRLFRSQKARWLFAGIHPRWTVGFAHSWSSHSRKAGGYTTPDTSHIEVWAEGYMKEHGKVDHFVFGHLHHASQKALSDGTDLTVLGDSFKSYSYATFDGKQLQLKTFEGPKS